MIFFLLFLKAQLCTTVRYQIDELTDKVWEVFGKSKNICYINLFDKFKIFKNDLEPGGPNNTNPPTNWDEYYYTAQKMDFKFSNFSKQNQKTVRLRPTYEIITAEHVHITDFNNLRKIGNTKEHILLYQNINKYNYKYHYNIITYILMFSIIIISHNNKRRIDMIRNLVQVLKKTNEFRQAITHIFKGKRYNLKKDMNNTTQTLLRYDINSKKLKKTKTKICKYAHCKSGSKSGNYTRFTHQELTQCFDTGLACLKGTLHADQDQNKKKEREK